MTNTTTHTKQELDDIIAWFDAHSDSIRISWLPIVKSDTECVYVINWHSDADRLGYWMHSASTVSE